MRTPEQLDQDRRAALLAWEQARGARAEIPPTPGSARDARHELERHQAAREREEQALQSRLAAARPEDAGATRAVIAHRMAWTRTALRQGLEQAGVAVVEELEDGCSVLGTAVAEQPDLVLVQQQLPWLGGVDLVRELRQFAPAATLVVHLDTAGSERSVREAGADLVLPRSARPQDIVEKVLQLTR